MHTQRALMALTLPVASGRWTFTAACLLLVATISQASCPPTCFCNTGNKIVYCARRGLQDIPQEIPGDSLEINLNENLFTAYSLVRSNFSRFSALTHLYLNECGIEAIDVDTFADLKNLKWLALSDNRIRYLREHAFRGLHLQHLFLNGNRNLRIVPGSFVGLSTKGLYLSNCALTEITTAQLTPLSASLRTLHLFDNKLTRLEPSLVGVFSPLEQLRLETNPLHCSCEISWLKSLYDSRAQTLFSGASPPGCWTPPRMTGQLFSGIPAKDLRCEAPTFNNIDARIGGEVGRLRCTATGDPAPTLYWIRPTGTTRRYSPPADKKARFTEGVLTIARHVGHRDTGMYICVAHNEAGNVTLTLNVSWPHPDTPKQWPTEVSRIVTTITARDVIQSSTTTTTTTTSPSTSQPATTASSEPHAHPAVTSSRERTHANYTSSKAMLEICRRRQEVRLFNVTEIIGAVIGTHVCTLLLCLIFMPVYYKRRWRRQRRDSIEKAPHPEEARYLNELRQYVDNVKR